MVAIFERLGVFLLVFSWEIAVLIAVVAVIERLLGKRSSMFRYLLWVAVLVRLAVPVSVPVPDAVTDWIRGLTVESVPVERLQVRTPMPVTVEYAPAGELERPLTPVMSIQPEEKRFAMPVPITAMAGATWLGILGLLAIVILIRWLMLRYALKMSAVLHDGEIDRLVTRLSSVMGLARPVETRVWNARSKEAVALAGVFRPRILLPRGMAESWLPEELEPVITHELAHVKRADLVVNWLQVIIQAIYFFHPLVWYLNHRIRHLREEACDDLAISVLGGSRKRYIESMLRVLDETSLAPAFGFAAIGFSERRSNIGERIRRIMTMKGTFSTRLTARAVCGLTGVLVVAFAISCGAGSVLRPGNTADVRVVRPPVTEVLVAREGDDPEARQATVRKMLSSTEHDNEITLAAVRTSDSDSLLVGAIRNVAAAVSRETDLDVSVREMTPGDPALLDCTAAFMLGTEDIRKLTPEEAANLGAFMRGGGFLYADVIDPTQINGKAEDGLHFLLQRALAPDYRLTLPIMNNYPIYNCYYDFHGDSLAVYVNSAQAPSMYIEGFFEGIHVDDNLVGLLSKNDYINRWAAADTGDAMELGVNIVIYNVLRERGVQIRNTLPGENDTARIQGTGMPGVRRTNNITVDITDDGTYLINGEVVAKDELEQVLRATKVPNTEPLTNTLIVSGPGEANQFVRSEEYACLDSVASSLSINGRRIVIEDEGPGMSPTMPPALGIPDIESEPIMLEMLDDGTYLVNGEVVAKDDLARFSDAFQIKKPGAEQQSRSSVDQSVSAVVTDVTAPAHYQIPAYSRRF